MYSARGAPEMSLLSQLFKEPRKLFLTSDMFGKVSSSDLVFEVDAVQPVQVGLVAVLVPPTTSIRHGTARDERRRVSVFGREDTVVMVSHGIT